MSPGALVCSRCFQELPHDVPPLADIYGAPVCRECHELEWTPDAPVDPEDAA